MIHVRLFGGVSVTNEERWLPLDLGPQGRHLLGYLFEFPNTPHRRDMLVDRIWWDVDPDRARRAFNTVLWRLRKLLEAGGQGSAETKIQGNKLEVFLDLSPNTWVDTVEFRKNLTGLDRRHDSAPDSQYMISRLSDAFDTYRGPFMDGEDAEWIIEERERLHSLYVQTGARLARLLGAEGRYAEGADIAKQILQVDPYRERLHCDLLLLLTANGQRAEAIQIQEIMAQRLRAELGIAPMPETLALAEMIKTNAVFAKLQQLKTNRWTG